MSNPTPVVEVAITVATQQRARLARRRNLAAVGVSAFVSVVWAIAVTWTGSWDRVANQWVAAVTMIFGSFVAGSTPQGGGAVAFPVFTKALDIPTEVARSFSLMVQMIGMGAATASIALNRRAVSVPAILIAAPMAVAGFLLGYVLVLDRDTPFGRTTLLPGPYVKVVFTIVVVAMAFVTWFGFQLPIVERRNKVPVINWRVGALIGGCGLIGGFVSLLVGSGADVFVYLALAVMIGVSPKVSVATSVIVMTIVSTTGFVLLGLIDGQLAVGLDPGSNRVNQVADRPVGIVDSAAAFALGGLDVDRYDLTGLWLAAVPVVVWGAPLGSAVATRITDRGLVRFVVSLAAIEVITTVVFVEQLRSDRWLASFAVAGMVTTVVALHFLSKRRRAILRLPPIDPNRSYRRGETDAVQNLPARLGVSLVIDPSEDTSSKGRKDA